jgi:hypothetical protein
MSCTRLAILALLCACETRREPVMRTAAVGRADAGPAIVVQVPVPVPVPVPGAVAPPATREPTPRPAPGDAQPPAALPPPPPPPTVIVIQPPRAQPTNQIPAPFAPYVPPTVNDAGILVPAVPLFIDPSAPPGAPGNGAPVQ